MEEDRSASASLEVLAKRLGHSLGAGTISKRAWTIVIDFYHAPEVDQKNALDALLEIAERASQANAESVSGPYNSTPHKESGI
jgi:hypothetical protein